MPPYGCYGRIQKGCAPESLETVMSLVALTSKTVCTRLEGLSHFIESIRLDVS
jgi:hypothetical protein